ncbi:unnamed protein product [Absidia cylindrospora]
MKEDYSHPQRRYTDTCLYLTPPSTLYTNATKNRLSCTVPSSSSSITDHHRHHYRRRLLSLDGHIPLLPKNSKHRRHSMSETIRHPSSKTNVTDCSANSKHQQQYAMASTTAPSTNVIKSNPLAHKSHTSMMSLKLPISLQGKITPEQFEHTITTIKTMLESAERLSWSGVLYNTLEILTIYLWPLFFNSHYHKMIHQLLAFIDKENREVYQQQKLSICNPVKAAFLFIEIQVFD